MANIYYDEDADLNLVIDKTIAVLGYGNQGRSQALNMRDQGIKRVIIGSVHDESYDQAVEDGFEVFSIEEATSMADVIFVLLPDEVCPKIFDEQMRPNFKPGVLLNFASGYNITFPNIKFPEDSDVVMAAPRMLGQGVREMYLSGEGYPAFVAVAQDVSGKALEYGKALCKAIGATKKGVIEGSINDETYLDLLTEIGVMPLIYKVYEEAFDLLTRNGHSEEVVLMEAYLSKEPSFLWEQAAERGFFRQLCLHSRTAQYAELTRLKDMDGSMIREHLEKSYESIKNGSFNKEWQTEQNEYNNAHLEELRKEALETPVTKAEDKLFARLK